MKQNSKTILDALLNSAKTSIEMQKARQKMLDILTSKAFFSTLTFDQQMILLQNTLNAESVSNNFMIDFVKAINRSPDTIFKALESVLTIDGIEDSTSSNHSISLLQDSQADQLKKTAYNILDSRRGIRREVDER